MANQFGITPLNLGEHAVESVGEPAEIVVGHLGGAHGVVAFSRHGLGCGRQMRDRAAHGTLQAAGKEKRQHGGQRQNHDHDRGKPPLTLRGFLEIVFKINGADRLAAILDAVKQGQPASLKPASVLLRPGRQERRGA